MELKGIFIRSEYIEAVNDLVAFSKGGAFALPEDSDDMMTVTSDNEHQEVDAAEPSAGSVAFPTSFKNPFLGIGAGDKPKKKGVAISGSPGTGEHNHLGRVASLISSKANL